MFTGVIGFSAIVILYLNQPLSFPSKPYNPVLSKFLTGFPTVIAHRGGSLENRENSLSAIQTSLQLDIAAIHMDVRKTKDGKFILAADESLQRITGQNKLISETYYEDISPFLNKINSEFGGSFYKDNVHQESPPLLSDIIDIFNGSTKIVFMDFHEEDITEAKKVLSMLEENGLLNQTIFKTKCDFSIIRKNFPNVNLVSGNDYTYQKYQEFLDGSLNERTTPFIADLFLTTFDFLTLRKSSMSVKNKLINREGLLPVTLSEFVFELRELKGEVKILNKVLKEKGIPIVYWLANNVIDFKEAIILGADAIMTGKPAEMREVRARKKKTFN